MSKNDDFLVNFSFYINELINSNTMKTLKNALWYLSFVTI